MGLGLVNAACAYHRPIPEAPLAADSTHPAPVAQRWVSQVNQGFLGPVLLRGDTLFGAGYDRRVVAVTLPRGKEIWDLRQNGGVSSGVVASNDTLYVASDRPDGSVAAIGMAHGRDLWKRRHTGRIALPLALIGPLVIAAPKGGGLLALDRAGGDRAWTRRLAPAVTAPVEGRPGEFLVATGDSVFRFSADSGKLLQGVPAPGPLSAPWVRSAAGVILATGTGVVAELAVDDLAERWQVQLDGPVLVAPTLQHDTLWAATQRGTIYRIPLAAPRAERVATLTDPISAPVWPWRAWLLVGMADGTLRALDSTGTEAWRVAVGRPLTNPPLPLPDGFLILGGRGDIHRMVAR